MKKGLLSLIAALGFTALAAQTSLPTSWSFTTTSFPNGWTSGGTTYYSGSGNTPPALKFDNTADWLEIHFSGAPGPLSYYITGNSFSGGSFDVEESVNGTTWTTLHHWDDTSLPPGNYVQYTDNPASTSRYIRFYYTQKVSGNVGLDDVNIAAPPASPAQEINVQQNSATVVSGGTIYVQSPVSTNTPFNLDIQNLGTANTLNISSVNITGPDAADFSVASAPTTVAANSTGTLTVNFTPAAAGARYAVITINSDDADEPAYVVNVYGIGGSYATEPTAQASNLQFSNIKSYRFTGSFTAANPQPEGYIVLRNDAGPVTDIPVDGVSYSRGDVIGSSKVVFSGTMTSFAPIWIKAASTYHFAVFSYNGPGQYRNYLTTAPLTGNVTTSGSMQPSNFYNSVNSQNAGTFISSLTALINPHTDNFYSNYGPRMVSLFWARDTTNDQRVVTCVYSGNKQVYTEPFAWTTYSREHTYCHSWMPSYNNQNVPEYSDYFNLFPTDQNNANVIRSNYPLGEVVSASYTFMGCKFGLDAAGHAVFEPRDEQKGDAARAIFYMATSYNTTTTNWGLPNPISTSIQYGQDQNVLKAWHYMDPPDALEIARNDFIDSLQGNRNPFIDSVQFACYINFDNMTYISNPTFPCGSVGVQEQAQPEAEMMLMPNPASGNSVLFYNTKTAGSIRFALYDLSGRCVISEQTTVNSGVNQVPVHSAGLAAGTYFVRVEGGNAVLVQKFLVE